MKKKWFILAMVMLVSASLLTGCLSSDKAPAPAAKPEPAKDAAAGKKIIRISIGLNEVHPEYLGLVKFKEEIEKKLPGKYDIQLYANAQLGDDVKTTEAVRMGNLEMTGPSTSPLTGIVKELGVFDMPFLFSDIKTAYTVCDGPAGQKILDMLDEKGLKGLAYWENGFRHLTNSVREVKTPADTKGMKIRTMQNPIHLATWKALGSNPTPMPFSEVFTAMQQKTIDGQENPTPTIFLSKFNEVQKYMTLTGHVYTPFVLLIGKKLWDGMPKEDQKVFQDAAYVARDHVRDVSLKMNTEYVAKLKAAGMTVTELTPDQLKSFQDAVKPVYDEYTEKVGKATVESILAEAKKVSGK